MKKRFSLFVMVLVCLALVAGTVLACNAKFVLNFNVDGEIYHQIRTDGEEEIALPENPVKDGWIFDGWYWDNGIWAEPFTAQSLLNVPLESDMTVFAKWINADITQRDFNVVFDSMGGSAVSAAVVRYGNLLTRPNAPTRDGYIFIGWYRDAAFEAQWNFSADTVTENITLYARWVPSTDAAGADIIASGGMTMTGDSLYIELPNATTVFPFSAHITVSPWAQYSVSTDIAGANVIPSATVEIEPGDNVFYIQTVSGNGSNRRQYTATVRRHEMYTVTYDFGRGAEAESVVVEEDSLTEDKAAPLTGYTLDGWYFGEDKWDFSDPVTSDMTLTARYTPNVYTVSFDSAGGGAVESAQVTFDSAFEFIVPERTGYEFLYWSYEDAALTDAAGASVGVYSVADDITVTAVWETVKYSVVYHDVDGASNLNPAVYDIESATFTLTAPVKRGYDFVGWFADEQKETAADITVETGSVGNLEFWAKWSATEYSLEFVLGNGEYASEQNPSVYTIEDEFTFISPVPTVAGYTFDSWRLGSASGAEYTGITAGTTGDMTFYAAYTPIIYDIAYAGVYNGTHSNPATYTVESATITLSAASRTGYTFDGWYVGDDLVTEIVTGSYGDKTFTAQWTPITYEIVYENTKGAANSNATEYTIESDTIALLDISATGYTFDGWYVGDELVTEIAEGSYGDKTFTAQWTPITYEIVYENTKGAANANVTEYTIESDTITLSGITATGYTFDGWYVGDELVTEIVTGSYGDKTFTAKWTPITYTIVYNYDDGIGDVSEGMSLKTSYTIEDEFTFASLTAHATGYYFTGWYTEKEEDTGTLVGGITAGTIGDRTVFAHWGLEEYDITYHNTEGVTNTNPATYTVETETFTIGAVSRIGYTFGGWFADADTETPADTTIETGSHGDIDIYAKWTAIEYDIVYNLYGGSATGNPEKYTIEDSVSFADATLAGSYFAGWYDMAEGGELVTGITAGSTGTVTLYARYITFDSVGGSEINYDMSYSASGVTQPDAPTKAYYDFDGWYLDSEYQAEFDFSLPDGNVTLYAKWTATEYAITYVLNGGNNSAENPETYTVEESVVFAAPVKTGYTFNGWYSDPEFTTVMVESIPVGSHGAMTIYASFSINSYTISFNTNGGTTIAEIEQNYGTEVTAPAPPAKNGYTFGGWYSDSSLRTPYAFTTIPAYDVELWAKWNVVYYEIVYNTDGGANPEGNPARYTVESSAITFLSPTKRGYTFGGWYLDSALSDSTTGIPAGSTGAVELWAKWDIIEYDIIYILNEEGAENPNVDAYTVESAVFALEAAVLKGYTFDGWFTSGAYLEEITHIGGGEIGSKTLYGKFAVNTYNVWMDGKETTYHTVSFDLNGAEGSIPSVTVTPDAGLEYPAVPSRSGYVFGGWYIRTDFSGEPYDFTAEVGDDITLYAKWVPASGNVISVGGSASVNISGTEEHSYSFIPLVSGNVTVTATGGVDTIGFLYNSEGELLRANDDGAADGLNFLITYNVTAGRLYEIVFRGSFVATSGNITLLLTGATSVADGGVTATTGGMKEITFGTHFTLDSPAPREGFVFRGWADAEGVQYTDETGKSVRVFDKDEETVLYSVWEADGFTVTFVTNSGSAIDPVTIPYGDRLDLNQYITARSGYSFVGWFISMSDEEAYNATTMPDHDITLYARWTTYTISPIKYDPDLKAVSSLRDISAADFGATCFDTDGNMLDITAMVVSGTQEAGNTVTVRLTATNNNKTQSAMISGVSVYGSPVIAVGEAPDYFNISDGLSAEWFDVTATDTFGTYLGVTAEIAGDYSAGDVVTVVFTVTDAAGNVSTDSIGNIKVYGAPVITADEDIPGIKDTDTLSAALFGAAAADSFAESVSVSVAISSGSQTAGTTIGVTFTAVDGKGNENTLTLTYKVYGTPAISEPETTEFKVEDVITPEALGMTAEDSFGAALEISLSTEDAQTAGAVMSYTASVTDVVGNTQTLQFTVKIYGTPDISYTRGAIKVTEDPVPNGAAILSAAAYDSFGTPLDITVALAEGIFAGGEEVRYTLTASDHLGNEVSLTTDTIRVYDLADISLTFDAWSATNIKLTSTGEEFSAYATDSFGEACVITLERADGGDLVAGEEQSVVIVATDAAGNEYRSEAIAGIKVFDMPVIRYFREHLYVLDGENAEYLFTATDSFGSMIDATANITAESATELTLSVSATDDAGNTTTEIFVLDKLSSASYLFLTVGGTESGVIIGGTAVSVGAEFSLPRSVAGTENFTGWSLDGELITDAEGNSLSVWSGVPNTVYYVNLEADIITYTVTYALNGGTNSADNPSEYTILTLGSDGAITLSAPTKTGDILSYTSNSDGTFDVTREAYTFEGWYTNSDFTGEAVTELTIDTGNITLYAKWSESTITTTEQLYTRSGSTIYFGEYPQTEVTDSAITSALNGMSGTLPTSTNSYDWTSYGYYIRGDVTNFMWYIDLEYSEEKYRGVYFTSYRPYDTTSSSSTSKSYQDDNGYSTGTVYWFRYEPIKWRILTESDGKAMILSELMLDSQQYNYASNNYANSTIRRWLKGTFYNTAFGELQQAIIETTEVDNSVYSTGYSSNPYACENTFDKVFLLSYREARNSSYGFSTSTDSNSTRLKQGSDYCKAQGSYTYSNGKGSWWLRSPLNTNRGNALCVYYGGNLGSNNVVYSTSVGIVPALWIIL